MTALHQHLAKALAHRQSNIELARQGRARAAELGRTQATAAAAAAAVATITPSPTAPSAQKGHTP